MVWTPELPALIWIGAHSSKATEIPIFYSNALSDTKATLTLTQLSPNTDEQESWLVSWIEQRYRTGATQQSELLEIEQLFSKIFYYSDGEESS